MVTEIIKVDVSNPDLQTIKYAAGIIDNGGLVAFPTETVYGIACRVTADSLAKLDQLKSRGAEKRYTLHIGQKTDIEKYVPRISLIAEKLIKKAWPGPLTIVFELDKQDLDVQYNRLDEAVCKFLYIDNTIGIRCPENLIAQELLLNTSQAVVAPSANPPGTRPAVNAQEAVNYLDGQIDLILEGGSCKYGTSSSVVKIGKKGLEVLREGVYSSKQVYEMGKVNILFVCTGNTCRSPMAAGLCRKYISEKFGCDVDRLEQIGYNIGSAGVMAATGIPVTDEAVKACQKKSVDIKVHRARPLSAEIVDKSDIIFVMSENHRFCVNAFGREAEAKCFLLDKNGDIADPIAGGQDTYDRCCELIDKAVRERLSELNL